MPNKFLLILLWCFHVWQNYHVTLRNVLWLLCKVEKKLFNIYSIYYSPKITLGTESKNLSLMCYIVQLFQTITWPCVYWKHMHMNQISTSFLKIKRKVKQWYNLTLENITRFELIQLFSFLQDSVCLVKLFLVTFLIHRKKQTTNL